MPQNVEECGVAGVEGVIIVSAGFKETGAEGEKLEERIRETRKKYSMRIVGPNCLGGSNPQKRPGRRHNRHRFGREVKEGI